jgi:hypothetical protein
LTSPTREGAVAVETICGVYRVNRERHDPDSGDDAVTFGTHSYRNVHHALEDHFEGHPRVNARREWNAVVLDVTTSVGTVSVRTYKYGRTVRDDPRLWKCDDSPAALRHAIRNGAGDQLALFDDRVPFDREAPRALVLLHAGNEIDGAVAVHLGAPAIRDGQHDGWHFLTPLWSADTTTADVVAESGAAGFREQPIPSINIGLIRPTTSPAITGEQAEQ